MSAMTVNRKAEVPSVSTALVLRREVQPAPRRRLEWTALAAGVIALLYMLYWLAWAI